MAATIAKQDLISLLTEGRSQTEIAALLKVTPSAIAQAIESDEKLQNVVASAQAAKGNVIDESYDDIEQLLLKKLKGTVAFMSKPMEIARVLQTVNAAKRRTGILATPRSSGAPTVTLVVPVAIQHKIVMNAEQQVTEVGGRPLVTMGAGQVLKMMQDRPTLSQILDMTAPAQEGAQA